MINIISVRIKMLNCGWDVYTSKQCVCHICISQYQFKCFYSNNNLGVACCCHNTCMPKLPDVILGGLKNATTI